MIDRQKPDRRTEVLCSCQQDDDVYDLDASKPAYQPQGELQTSSGNTNAASQPQLEFQVESLCPHAHATTEMSFLVPEYRVSRVFVVRIKSLQLYVFVVYPIYHMTHDT